MGMDYGVHAVYGVLLEGEARTLWVDGLARAAAQLARDPDDSDLTESERIDDEVTWLRHHEPELEKFVKEAAGAPAAAELFWTGSDDDRPGRCDTDCDEWVAGFGMYDMPRPGATRGWGGTKPGWHTWVTYG